MINFKQHDANARLIWDLLIRHARLGAKLITYGEVEAAIALDRFNQKYALEVLQIYCEMHNLPHLTSLVVLGSTRKPSRGNTLTESHLTTEYARIANYDWPAAPETFLSEELEEKFAASLKRRTERDTQKTKKAHHWLLQVNPKIWDIAGYLEAGHQIDRWAISQNKKLIRPGDRFILWLSGNNGGAIGWGRMGTKLDRNLRSPNDEYWERPKSDRTEYYSLSVDELFFDTPIPRNVLKADATFGKAIIFRAAQSGNAMQVQEDEWAAFEAHLKASKGLTVLDDDELELRRIDTDATIAVTEKLALRKSRVGQGLYRERLQAIESSCRVTGVSDPQLLTASHIKPWAVSTDSEKLDGNNGLFLSPHIDRLFDRGLVSFTDTGNLLVSAHVAMEDLDKWGIEPNLNVGPFSAEQAKYLSWHRHEYAFKPEFE
jgi:hypothetical protein